MSNQDVVPRLNAALDGRYRVERKLGEGGMATVYLARDLRHERSVALKVLKPELAAVVGAERFLAEIKTTANLQHPHILQLFDSGEADSFLFYVMPYVDGESLRDRLDREHQLPVDEAVQIARNVAEALEYAHARGVIHRDIKPANILLQSGKPVVSDFGIALAVRAGGIGRLTETGLSLGTPHYMSPEQATGDATVGPATDIYALGCVLYEMLVGEPPYTGSTPQAILGKIIQAKPVAASAARPTVPANVDGVIRKALEKVPADRFASAAEVARGLADGAFRYGASEAGPEGRRWRSIAFSASAVAAVLAAILVGLVAFTQQAPMQSARVIRFESPFPDGQAPSRVTEGTHVLSPDGSMLVYTRPDLSGDTTQLWVRRWDDLQATPIGGTVGATEPAISFDNALLAFQRDREVTVLPLAGGTPRTLGRGVLPRWAPNGDLFYTSDPDTAAVMRMALMRAPSGTAAPQLIRALPDSVQGQFVWDVLPDGVHALVAYYPGRRGESIEAQLGVVDVETGELTRLLPGDWPAVYTPSGHLVYWADSTMMAAPFDPDRMEVGSPVRVMGNLWRFDIASDGSLVYATFPVPPSDRPQSDLVLVRPGGGREVLAELEGTAWFPRFSPDGSGLAYGLNERPVANDADDPGDLWVLGMARRERTRVTFSGNNMWYPIWSPDGRWLTHADAVGGSQNRMLSHRADGSNQIDTIFDFVRDTVVDSSRRRFPTSWSPDGRTLAYYSGQGAVNRDIWMLRIDGEEHTPTPYIMTEFMEVGAIFSPDGRWVAYVSNKSGEQNVYVRPFPGPGSEVTVSVGGGIEPVWSRGGDEIYYRREGELMVVPVRPSGSTLSVGAAERVMTDEYARQILGGAGGMANYDVMPDGTGFVMIERHEQSGGQPSRLFVVFNWLEELKRLAPN
jgi:serine/threonine-protein kinase